MINKEVVPAFDMLLEELERIIPDLNDQAKALMDLKNYDQAHTLLNKAQSVVTFQGKVQSLRDEWVRMQVPSLRSGKHVIEPIKNSHQAEKGELTSRFEFYMPILQVLVDLGGRAHIRKVVAQLEKRMGTHFTKKDMETLPSGRQEIRWINTVRWARSYMIGDGLLVKDSPRGIWEITPAGREHIKAKNE